MNHTLVNVSVPFVLEFLRRRCSKAESGIFWEDGTIAIRTVTAQQAPTVCRVRTEETGVTSEFSVRSYEGGLWWPLFDGLGHMPVKDYVASATKSEGPFLSMMNLSPATVYSEPRRDAKRFFEQIFARRVDGPLRVERWRSPQRIAHRTLFCDDLVYIEGGRPVYFGVRRGMPSDPMLSLEVGSAEAEHFHLASRYFPGPLFKERRDAACRSLVYGIESIGDEIDVLRRSGVLVAFASKAEVHIEFRSDRDACEICADALVRRAVAAMDPLLLKELEEMLQRELRAAALSFQRIPSALCGDAISAMTATSPEDEFFGRFGVEFEWAAKTLSRLDAMHTPICLSELDEQSLFALAATDVFPRSS